MPSDGADEERREDGPASTTRLRTSVVEPLSARGEEILRNGVASRDALDPQDAQDGGAARDAVPPDAPAQPSSLPAGQTAALLDTLQGFVDSIKTLKHGDGAEDHSVLENVHNIPRAM